MPIEKMTMARRIALLERELAEMKTLLQVQASNSDAVPARAMAAAAAATVVVSPNPTVQPAMKVTPLGKDKDEAVSPEIMAVISAAVAHFLNLRARIRHTHMVRPTGVNPWAQQGRVFIQASHNLAHR
jgi:hypothetical protein